MIPNGLKRAIKQPGSIVYVENNFWTWSDDDRCSLAVRPDDILMILHHNGYARVLRLDDCVHLHLSTFQLIRNTTLLWDSR